MHGETLKLAKSIFSLFSIPLLPLAQVAQLISFLFLDMHSTLH